MLIKQYIVFYLFIQIQFLFILPQPTMKNTCKTTVTGRDGLKNHGENPESKPNSQSQLKLSNLLNLFQLQCKANQLLMWNTMLCNNFFRINNNTSNKTTCSDYSTLPSSKQKTVNSQVLMKGISQSQNKIENSKKGKRKTKSDSQYQIPSQYEQAQSNTLMQTKNIPKNYGKMLLNFIVTKNFYVKKVMNRLQIDEKQFTCFIKSRRNNLSSIADLRNLWMQNQLNPYGKATRIISIQCFRKYSLCYIFNSRIEKQRRNVKYRTKFLKALQNPEQFTQMKDF